MAYLDTIDSHLDIFTYSDVYNCLPVDCEKFISCNGSDFNIIY